ncbi:alpha-mannosidase 2-like isoform X2 [Camellia sinensis]|uniref:alpha-mannosidase 2-like isoform X2 n=1 Tax=Camellia sinensis TaxID=4442 RepID=UPI001036D955|nr:alpha-mannosidase 2-like isoform X2 [Camellia sinensis]
MALSKDPRCKFIWEEMSYLERWWKDASETKKESFINLVKNAQLEIVGGGWVMNDEANSHYFAIIEQRTHYDLKKELAFSKNLEYIWRQNWDSEEALQVYDINGLPIMKESQYQTNGVT